LAFTGPNAITKSGTVVFGPSLSTPVPLGQVISVMIYRGINAPYSPPSGASSLDFSDPANSGFIPTLG
jgi:hypothetical protein